MYTVEEYTVIIVCMHARNSVEEDMAMAENQCSRFLLLFPVLLFTITSISVDIVSGQPTGEYSGSARELLTNLSCVLYCQEFTSRSMGRLSPVMPMSLSLTLVYIVVLYIATLTEAVVAEVLMQKMVWLRDTGTTLMGLKLRASHCSLLLIPP